MIESIVAAAIAAIASVTSAFISAHSNKTASKLKADNEEYQRKRDAQEHERRMVDEVTQQALLAMLDSLDMSLVALQGGKLNGNVEAARMSVKQAKNELQRTRTKALAHLMSGGE